MRFLYVNADSAKHHIMLYVVIPTVIEPGIQRNLLNYECNNSLALNCRSS